ncbi:MAG TPA: DUF805 domain-containing protein [Hellea balneolensis]|uniref:DUF805 domain-containing protein n=1 Tax=Hellea balneolensis TaxID=287478 RepID=A0A7C3CA66_9PROT|nr:DUF805 domain-containing protein [Hellea balneolensis]
MLKLFLSPKGRLSRQPFALAVILWFMFYVLQGLWFKQTGTNSVNFFLAIVFLFLNLHIILCIYGKRLRDIGHSLWVLVGIMALMVIVSIFVMLNYGGLTYFDTLMQHPEIAENAEAMQHVHEAYRQELSTHISQIRVIMAGIPVLFTVWLALRPGHVNVS